MICSFSRPVEARQFISPYTTAWDQALEFIADNDKLKGLILYPDSVNIREEMQTLRLDVIPASQLTAGECDEIIDLCSRAYEEDFEVYRALLFQNAVHVRGWIDDVLVTHALWLTRWLQLETGTMLKTAYIEAVATDQAFRNRGYASRVMRRVAAEIQDFDIAGLSPFSERYYARLGWEKWRGPLLIRQNGKLLPTPPDEDGDEECLMILRLPKTPDLDLDSPISIEWREGEVW